jgi:hypothetical protein
VIEEIREEITKFLECSENENTTLPESVGQNKGHVLAPLSKIRWA